MIIYNQYGVQILTVEVNDNSYRNRQIMGDHNLTLYFSLAEHTEIPVGAYCYYENERYTLERPENIKMVHSRNFEYTVIMESPQAKAKIWKFRNTVDGRLKFSLTAKPLEHLAMFVENMNRRDSGWTVGDCIDGTETLISYDHAYCFEALSLMAQEFDTEFEITGKRVSLRKLQYNKNAPLALSYGRGNGFKSGVGRSNNGDTPPVEILYAQGGEQNIDASRYGGSVLLLPKGQAIGYDGEKYEGESGFQPQSARYYVVDEDGLSVRRSDRGLSSFAEDSLDCSDNYPKRVGAVTAVVVESEEQHLYDIVDNTIPQDLNFEDCIIDGQTMTVKFQSGMLAGREFDVAYRHNAVGGRAAKRFEILPQKIDGQDMPNSVFAPVVGDKYIVLNCTLPEAYIRNDSDRSGAEWDMFRTAVRYLYEHEESEFSFTGELDGIWAARDWENIGGRLVLGGYILFSDERFQQDGVLVRITGIKDYINSPHSPEITLSNAPVASGFSSTIKALKAQEVVIGDNRKEAVQYTQRRFRDAKETMGMIEAALLDNFTNGITPVTVQTMSALVGDESLQYRFVVSAANPTPVAHTFNYDNSTKQLSTAQGVIQHLTLGVSSLSSAHANSEYHYWAVGEFTSAALLDGAKKYYLYIKASQAAQTAVFRLSEQPIGMTSEAGYYHLLVGVLNSEYNGERSFVTLYGYTEVLPGRMTTDRIVSGDGQSYFDMVNNAMKLGEKLQFNADGDGKLVIKGVLVQSESGSQNYVGCYRGTFSSAFTYFKGDEVSYTKDGLTSTYRHINDSSSRGVAPTNTSYWQVVAQGAVGAAGKDGEDGQNGKSPAMVFRGDYSSSKSYYGNENRLDCVKYGEQFYIARIDPPTSPFSNKPPTNNMYWNSFGANFESVATGLLMAEQAMIDTLAAGKIVMKDNQGNILFQAKDGNVTCKTGTFENVTVNGDLNISKTNYQVNQVDANGVILGTVVDYGTVYSQDPWVITTRLPIIAALHQNYREICIFIGFDVFTRRTLLLYAQIQGQSFKIPAGSSVIHNVSENPESVEFTRMGYYKFVGTNYGQDEIWCLVNETIYE